MYQTDVRGDMQEKEKIHGIRSPYQKNVLKFNCSQTKHKTNSFLNQYL